MRNCEVDQDPVFKQAVDYEYECPQAGIIKHHELWYCEFHYEIALKSVGVVDKKRTRMQTYEDDEFDGVEPTSY
jgi:hypothetical protein